MGLSPEELKAASLRRLHTCVHSSTIHKSGRVELTQVSTNERMGKQNATYTHDGICSLNTQP